MGEENLPSREPLQLAGGNSSTGHVWTSAPFWCQGLGQKPVPRAWGWVALVCALSRDLQKELPDPLGKGDGRSGLPAPWAGGQAPWWHVVAVGLPSSSSLASCGEMVGMPNHLGRCDQIVLLKGAKPVWLPYCAMINKGLQLFFFH